MCVCVCCGGDVKCVFSAEILRFNILSYSGSLVAKNSPVNAEDAGDFGSISGLGRSPGGRNGNPLQHSCLDNPMDRGAWWATVHRVAEN